MKQGFWLRAVASAARLLMAADAAVAGAKVSAGAELAACRSAVDRYRAECEILRARLRKMPARRRPRYSPWLRLRILWHRARHGLSLEEAARRFVVSAQTLARWTGDLERGVERLVKTRSPVNKLPDLVREVASLLKWEEVRWGTRRIAQVLARLGLKVSRTSVQRILRPPPRRPASRTAAKAVRRGAVTARHPDHVWLADFTTLKAFGGLIRIHVAAVLDAFSRSVVAVAVSRAEPTAEWTGRFLAKAIAAGGRKPKHLITDHGTQFTARSFVRLLRRRKIRHRYGAIGRPNSQALIERLWRSMKEEFARGVPLWLPARTIERRLRAWARWHTTHRPHQGLGGRSPADVRENRRPKILKLRSDDHWTLTREELAGERALPVYRLMKVA